MSLVANSTCYTDVLNCLGTGFTDWLAFYNSCPINDKTGTTSLRSTVQAIELFEELVEQLPISQSSSEEGSHSKCTYRLVAF